MGPENRNSHLMMFCGLLLPYSGKASFAEAMGILPLSRGASRLANLMGEREPFRSAAGTVAVNNMEQHDQEIHTPIADSAGAPERSDTPNRLSPENAFRHGRKEPDAGIPTRPFDLRCPVCGSEATFGLDRTQCEHLIHRGHLELHCSYCAGTSFWKPARPLAHRDYVASASVSPKNILVVEDDPATVQLLQQLLQAWDARVDVARDGKEALQQLLGGGYDLMVSELHLPDMNGMDLFRRIQEKCLLAPERVLFIGAENGQAVQQGLEFNGCSYCRKPLVFSEFTSQLEAIFASPRPAGSEASPALL
jgi:CheY-like chemotaxis protein